MKYSITYINDYDITVGFNFAYMIYTRIDEIK